MVTTNYTPSFIAYSTNNVRINFATESTHLPLPVNISNSINPTNELNTINILIALAKFWGVNFSPRSAQ